MNDRPRAAHFLTAAVALLTRHFTIALDDRTKPILIAPVARPSGAYKKMARKAGKVWKDHGALEYHECVADDVKPGKSTSFPQAVNAGGFKTLIER